MLLLHQGHLCQVVLPQLLLFLRGSPGWTLPDLQLGSHIVIGNAQESGYTRPSALIVSQGAVISKVGLFINSLLTQCANLTTR